MNVKHQKITDFCEIISGHPLRGAVRDFEGDDMYLIQSGNLPDDFIISDPHTLSCVSLPKINEQVILHDGDVLLAARGGIGGAFRAAVFSGEIDKPTVAAVSLFIIRPNPNVLPEYLALYLNSKEGQAKLQALGRGATVVALPKSEVGNIEVPVASLEQQQLTVDIAKNIYEQNKLLNKRVALHNNIKSQLITNLTTSV